MTSRKKTERKRRQSSAQLENLKKGKGRPAGVPNKATAEIRSLLDALAVDQAGVDQHVARLDALTRGPDLNVCIKALTLALSYRFGPPKQTVEIGGTDGGPIVFQVVTNVPAPARRALKAHDDD